MKKLIAMLSAVGMAFGLFAANYAISFEQAEDSQNMGVNTTSMQFTPPTEAGWTWEAEPFALSAYLTGDAFAYGAGAYARRSNFFFDKGLSANANYLPLSTGSDELTLAVGEGNIYLDQLVKFTGFEDPQTNLVAGTKIAVWMSEFENDDESTETNLYVTVGKVDANNVAEQVALKIDGTYSLDTWYRLSIKSLGDIYKGAEFTTPRAAFLVYVNGQQVTVAEEDMEVATALITNEGSMDGIAKGYMAKGQLFTAIDATDATFTSVGYQGIGAVDDIILDSVGPAFCQAIDVQIKFPVDAEGNPSVEVDYIDVGGVRMNYPCAVPDGTEITVYFKPAPGKKITGGVTSVTKTISTGDATINVSGIIAEDVVAKKNGTVDVAESELYTVLDALVENDKVKTISTCNVTNGEAEILYSFTPNTTITATAAGWDVFVGNFEMDNGEGGTIPSPGMLTVVSNITANFTMNVGVEDEAQGWVIFSGAAIDGQLAITNGLAMTEAAVTVGDGALLKAKNFTPSGFITLAGTGKVVTQTDPALAGMVGKIVDGKGNAVVPKANVPEAGWYTYALSDVPPEKIEYVTFSVTYDTAKVENVTVKTNGADVVDVEGVYTVESNAMVTVAATAKTGYQNVTITGDNVKVNAGVFKASEAESVITIAAEEILPAAYDITFATVENGTLETSVTNGIAAGTTVTVIATPATGYECTEITTNGTAITGTSFEMPADNVVIDATFTLQQFTVAAITVDNASVEATNKTAKVALELPDTVDYNTEIAVTVTPNENYEYKNAPAGWTKNEDGSITTNATVTADLTITVEAPTAAITPVNPGELIPSKTPEEVNANLDKYLKVPEIQGIDAATYRAMFAAKQAGDAVVIDLKPAVEEAIQVELNAATATVIAPDETGKATITARIGLYYGIKAAGEVGSVDTEAVQKGVQATTTTLKITVPTADSKATPFTDKAFFKTICSPKAFE